MAQGPIDYTSGFGQQSPFGGAMEAMQAGARFGVFEQQRAGLQQQQMMREQQMLAAQAERERQLENCISPHCLRMPLVCEPPDARCA